MQYTNGDIYVGNWEADKITGTGKMIYADGFIYEGEWKNSKKHGKGIVTYVKENVILEATWKNGYKCAAKYTFANGDCLQAEWQQGIESYYILAITINNSVH